MASSNLVGNGVNIEYQVGVNSAGKEVYRTQSFLRINADVSDVKIIAFADEVEKLLDHDVSSIKKLSTYIMSR